MTLDLDAIRERNERWLESPDPTVARYAAETLALVGRIQGLEAENLELTGYMKGWERTAEALADDVGKAEAERDTLRDGEKLAAAFHEAYERLAPDYGYTTRTESAVPWESVPLVNKRLMIAAATEAVAALAQGAGE